MPGGIATATPVGTIARSPGASENASTHARSYAGVAGAGARGWPRGGVEQLDLR